MLVSTDSLNLALRDEKIQVMNFLNEIANDYPQAISFAPGRPLEEFFDVESALTLVGDFVAYDQQRKAGGRGGYSSLGQYGRTNGLIGELIAKLLHNDERISVSPEDVVVTVGCQEAMCLCLMVLCANPGDVALIADPAYIGISGAARVLGIEIASVACNDDGLDLAALERQLAHIRNAGKRARLLYLSPDFANPTGVTTGQAQRQRLLEFTRDNGIFVLEDHAYSYFHFDEARHPPLKSLPGSEHVIYLGSFSKSIFPGLRLGFIAADQRVGSEGVAQSSLTAEISKAKSLLTVNTSPICQAIAGSLLINQECSLRTYVEPRRKALQRNRDAMIECLEEYFPSDESWCEGIRWNRPEGGFFLTLTLPFEVSDDDLVVSARQYGVLWTPMSYFYIDRSVSNQIRLSFSYVTADQVRAGISALAQMIKCRVSDALS